MAATTVRSDIASMTSRRVKARVLARLFILGCHPEAGDGVGLRAAAVLPAHVDLEKAQRDVRLDVEELLIDALVGARVADDDPGVEALCRVALLGVVADLRLEQ